MKPKEKPVRLTKYGQKRMRQRGISRSQAQMAVQNPDSVHQAKTPDAKIYEKRITARRRLAIITIEEEAAFRIINAFRKTAPKRKKGKRR